MMQKNEKELLDIWVQYHASLFGYENLYIFDNGSDIDVQEKLKTYTKKGVNVNFSFSSPKDFENKGGIIGELIKKLDKTSDYNFYFPLDCDEFLATFDTSGKISCSKEDILLELSGHNESQDALYIKCQFSNSAKKMGFFRQDLTRKSFFAKNTIKNLDKGFHIGSSLNGNKHKTNIIHFHFHYKPFYFVLESAKSKLMHRVDVNNLEVLEQYQGDGHHLKSYFFMTEGEYVANFENTHKEFIPCYEQYLNHLGINYPFLDYFLELENDFSYVNGHIDSVDIADGKLLIQGWCRDNMQCNYELKINNEVKHPIVIRKLDRYDVKKVHGNYDLSTGFALTFDLNVINLEQIDLFVSIGNNKFRFKNSQKLQDKINEFIKNV